MFWCCVAAGILLFVTALASREQCLNLTPSKCRPNTAPISAALASTFLSSSSLAYQSVSFPKYSAASSALTWLIGSSSAASPSTLRPRHRATLRLELPAHYAGQRRHRRAAQHRHGRSRPASASSTSLGVVPWWVSPPSPADGNTSAPCATAESALPQSPDLTSTFPAPPIPAFDGESPLSLRLKSFPPPAIITSCNSPAPSFLQLPFYPLA